TTNPGGGAGSSVLSLSDSAATPTAIANVSHLFSSGGEGYWMDSSGNNTLQTPHDSVTGEWIFSSENSVTGKRLRVEMEQLSKFIDEAFGMDFVKEYMIVADGSITALGANSATGDATIGSGAGGGVLSWLAQKVKAVLAELGMVLEDGVASLKQVVVDRFNAKTARIEKMEMVDSATGEIYCAWIKNGDWVKAKGECDKVSENSTGTSPANVAGNVPVISEERVKGCLDSQALNFNPDATEDSGDCLYPNQGPGESIEVEPTISAGTSPAGVVGNAPVEIFEPAVEMTQVDLPNESMLETTSPTE
ncbi:MAG: hypothetical protein US88_C0008G0001, partial [Parcubacteria group bacterium GW2011_GWA2_38_27]